MTYLKLHYAPLFFEMRREPLPDSWLNEVANVARGFRRIEYGPEVWQVSLGTRWLNIWAESRTREGAVAALEEAIRTRLTNRYLGDELRAELTALLELADEPAPPAWLEGTA